MSRESIEFRVVTIFRDSLRDDATLDSRIVEDLGCDSLDQVEIAMAIEDEFGVELQDEEWSELLEGTVRGVADYLVNDVGAA